MKTLAKIILFFLLALTASETIKAQATAVMKVSVTVVSGAGIQGLTDLEVSNSASSTDAYSNGSFTVVSSPNTEVLVNHQKSVLTTNETGSQLTIPTYSSIKHDSVKGTHTISFKAELPKNKPTAGLYKGSLNTTIEYL